MTSTTVQVSGPVRTELDRIASELRAEKGRAVSVTETIEWLIGSRAELVSQLEEVMGFNAELIKYSGQLEAQLAARDA